MGKIFCGDCIHLVNTASGGHVWYECHANLKTEIKDSWSTKNGIKNIYGQEDPVQKNRNNDCQDYKSDNRPWWKKLI